MALPKYNEFYRLVLTVLQDGQSHSMKEVRDSIAQTLQLTEEDLSETLSNGSSVYAGRVGWAKTYLKKAEMIDSPQRGYIAITPAGRSLLASTEPITNAVLAQKCPAFLDFYRPQNTDSTASAQPQASVPDDAPETPQETFERVYTLINYQQSTGGRSADGYSESKRCFL